MKSKVSKKGIFFLFVFVGIIAVLFAEPDKTTPNNVQVNQDEKAIIDSIIANSIVDTNVKFTESDSSLVTKFLDENNIDSPLATEKFGIETQVAWFDSNNNKLTSSDIFGVQSLPTSLSVLDQDGNPLDNGGYIQVTFASITKDVPITATSWGTVKFFLDDKELYTKKIWSNAQNSQKQDMSVLDSLSFEADKNNLSIDAEIKRLTDIQNILPQYSPSQRIDLATSLKVNDSSLEFLYQYLNVQISSLDSKKSILNEFPVPPSFSAREKRNFTYNFNDENLSDGSHTFRVVLYDLNAVVDGKNFNFKGENIVYELSFLVDNNRITKESESGNGIKHTVLKSDGTFSVKSPVNKYSYNTCCISSTTAIPSSMLPVSFEFFIKNDGKSFGIVDNSSFNQNIVTGESHCGGYPVQRCGSQITSSPSWNNPILTGIPRDVDLLIKTSDGKTIEFKTPVTQFNMFVSCTLDGKCTSNFGYSR